MVRFGQVVVGPPGSGKTTYCFGMFQYLEAIGRDAAVINLDPANHGEGLPYTPAVDIEELVSLEVVDKGRVLNPWVHTSHSSALTALCALVLSLCAPCISLACNLVCASQSVMEEFDLGPNGGMVYCLEYLEKNVDWLMERLEGLNKKYLIFDFPGQVELFTHCSCVQNLVQRLQKEDVRLAAVHLVDAYHCGNPSVFISATLLSLMVMLRLELPHINVLSKV
ncbi:unnamed protein product, partial [Laminaria digitata]